MSDPFEVVQGARLARLKVPFRAPVDTAAAEVSFAAHMAQEYTADPEAGPDYSTWLSAQEYARILGLPLNSSTYHQIKKYCVTAKVFGRLLIEPASAARYKIRHDLTRRSTPPARQ